MHCLLASVALATGTVVVDRPSVPAVGRQESLVRVEQFGRYAISAESSQGTAVQLVDRGVGPGPLQGLVGERNGRVDAFLERGDYKVVAWSDVAGTGDARIAVRPFVELESTPVLLPELRPVTTTLSDFQQRTWWIEGDTIQVEVAGRSLADLRVWQDGTWLVDVEPVCEVVEPTAGRAQRHCTMSAQLGEGRYAVVAYGGPALAWSSSSGDQPLHVRRGIPSLAPAGRLSSTMSPFGVDHYLVPDGVSQLSLALPSATSASLSASVVSDGAMGAATRASITKNSLPPQAELRVAPGGSKVVTVAAAAGQAYTLGWTPAMSGEVRVTRAGTYLVSVLPSGASGDSVDGTLLLASPAENAPARAAAVIPVGASSYWERRFNLLETTSVFLEVEDAGTYDVAIAGVEARFRIEPLWVTPPKGYVAPEPRAPGSVDLGAGYYRLTLLPETKGVVTASVKPGGWANKLKGAVGLGNAQPVPRQAPQVIVELGKGNHPLLVNRRPGVTDGLLVRALPADLDEGLPLWLGTSPVEVPVTVAEGRTVVVTAEDRRPIEISVDGGAWAVSTAPIGPGPHRVAVRHQGTEPVYVNVLAVPNERIRPGALPAAPPRELPDFPVVTAGTPRSGELGGEATATYLVRMERAGLVRLESTGLLATGGAVRTRTVTRLVDAAQNGVGRNFLVQTYLGQGDYQLSVNALPPSAGHYGVRLVPVELRDGGILTDGVPARAELPADAGVAYRFVVAEEGEYTVRSYGPGQEFRYRLEDADGFPVAGPEYAGPGVWTLPAGSYRVVLLPERVPSRRLTRVDRTPEPVVTVGPGPHPLALGVPAEQVWWERDPRTPDVWTLSVPAPVRARLEVSAEMVASLLRDGVQVGRSVPGETWAGELSMGAYRVEVVGARKDNDVPYTLAVHTEELVAGARRVVDAPTMVPVSVGTAGLYDLYSSGERDVRMTLWRDGVEVARSDDRPEDWNFGARVRLSPGIYELEIDPVGAGSARTTVGMSAPGELAGDPLTLGRPLTLTPDGGARLHTFQAPAGGLLLATGRSAENLGLAIERQVAGDTWESAGEAYGRDAQLLVRLGGGARTWRLRVWSLDGRGVPATVLVDAFQPLRTGEAAFRAGFGVGPVKGTAPAVGAAVVKADRAGLFHLDSTLGLSWCPYAERACEPAPGAELPATLGELWLVREGRTGASFAGTRVVVGTAPTPIAAGRSELTVDLARGRGGVAVLADGGLVVDVGGSGEARWDRGTGVATDGSVALSLSTGTDTARVRSGHPQRTARGSLRVVRFEPTELTLSGPRLDLELPAGAARRVRGADGVRLVLAEGVVAARVEGAGLGPVVVGPAATELPGAGDLLVLNLGAVAGAAAVERVEAAPTVLAAVDQAWERVETGAGVRLFELRTGGVVHVRGTDVSAALLASDGTLTRGVDLALSRGPAQLVVRHGPGPLLVWVGRDGSGRIPFGPAAAPVDVLLAGAASLGSDGGSYRFVPPAEGLLDLRLPPGVVARVEVGPEVRVLQVPATGRVPVVTPGAPVVVSVRGFAGQVLRGSARAAYTGVSTLGEGLGTELLYGAGDTRVFRLDLARPSPVGFGVGAAADRFDAALYGGDGRLLGLGIAQMPTLPAGRYYLALSLRADAPPTTARVAVVGVQPPDDGPPPEVVRSYLEGAP